MDFFYSDPHFGHAKIIEYCGRPFQTPDEMTEKLIDNYNRVVGPQHTVAWLGDCFFCPRGEARNILSAMNGTKVLILGSHDDKPERMMSLGFEWACYEALTRIAGKLVKLSHYPYLPKWPERTWGQLSAKVRGLDYDLSYADRRPSRIDGWLLHGHVHSAWKVKDRMINCGVDVWDYAPVSRLELARIVQGLDKKKERKR